MGLMSYFLDSEVVQTEKGIFISQKKYGGDILKCFKMEFCKPILTPIEQRLKLKKDGSGEFVNQTQYKQLVGNLSYLTATRPDITFGVELISRFMDAPHIDLAGDKKAKSTSGHAFDIGSGVMCWSSKK
ncbi:uncharacterized mitochondrial protein AtMg00810-like [Rosa rugosa]|uniref:uncharacterized mitochondrial protein AtMg00810-like n=1 Tax=Rosa rugosa TaxID=74645 RepID=UPI002B413B67|nr:uncharacterized mitochondrial protein AtMg00810-like [Rosa rugosa]